MNPEKFSQTEVPLGDPVIVKIPTLEEAEQIIQNENSYFTIPPEVQNTAHTMIDAGEYFYAIDDYNEDRKDPHGLDIKVYRSKEWLPEDPLNPKKDSTFKHQATYYTSADGLEREYLPQDLKQALKQSHDNLMMQKYPGANLTFARSNELFVKIYNTKNATDEEKLEYEEYHRQLKLFNADYGKIYKAAILTSPKIEKTVISFQNPLVIDEYDYDRSTVFQRGDIKDIRYIEPDEITHLKELGYDGVIVRQYDWFIKL
jgi:hypothetical protein